MIRKTVEYIRIPKKLFYAIIIGSLVAMGFKMIKPTEQLVDLTTIQEGLFQKTIVDEAMTEYSEKQIITAPADGITPKLLYKEGNLVKTGMVLGYFKWDREIPIKAPFHGYILKIFEKDERHVPRGTPLLEIGDPSELVVIARLLSEEVVDVKLGQRAIISKWGKNQNLDAVVTKIEKAAEEEVSALGVKEQRVKVHLKITTDREVWKALGDGYKVEVAIITEQKENVLLLPISTLFSFEGKPAIYTVKDNKAKLTFIEVGEKNKNFAELKTKLSEGAKVIQYPGPSLGDGVKVKSRQ